jgi:hypothetical protein
MALLDYKKPTIHISLAQLESLKNEMYEEITFYKRCIEYKDMDLNDPKHFREIFDLVWTKVIGNTK